MVKLENRLPQLIRQHWFYPLALAILVSDILVGRLDGWSNPGVVETGIIIDLALIIPALYYLCYRNRGKAAVMRTVVLCCLGIWLAGVIVPAEHQVLLSKIEFVRYVGLAVVVLLEIKLMRMIYGATFRKESEAKASVLNIAEKEGMPPWVAKIIAWEASIWRRIVNFFRRS